MLPKEAIQANCVQCHGEPDWPYAPLVHQGRRLFFERACYTCHTIGGLSYGSIGPELTEAGRKRRITYVKGKLENPRATNPTSTMPRQELTPEQVSALAVFLKAQQGARISRAPLAQFRSAQQQRPEWLPLAQIVGPQLATDVEALTPEKKGEALLPKVGCLSCHKLGDRDGQVGPELAFTSQQRDHGWVMAHFKDPKSVVPGSLMPPYPLPGETFESLTAYLLSRPVPPLPKEPAQQFASLCARCHGERGQGDGTIAAYIDPAPRNLTKAAFMRTKTRERLLDSVRNGVPGTSMAPWGRVLGEAGSEGLLGYVLDSLSKAGQSKPPTGRDTPAANPVAYSAESAARGEATFLNRCWGCHGKKADGHGPERGGYRAAPAQPSQHAVRLLGALRETAREHQVRRAGHGHAGRRFRLRPGRQGHRRPRQLHPEHQPPRKRRGQGGRCQPPTGEVKTERLGPAPSPTHPGPRRPEPPSGC